MRSSAEVWIDLSTEELLQDPPVAAPVEIEDVSAPMAPHTAQPSVRPRESAASSSDENCIEIELTAEQMDALLSGRL